jgi:hypothetical protein
MILGTMIAAAMAGALALPVAGTGATAARGTDTPPSANPLLSLVGAGFAAIGDAMHAVPILGPLATDVGESAFCAAEFVPVVGDVAKASVNKFDKDQKQGNACSSAGSAGSSGGSAGSAGSAGGSAGSSTGSAGSSSGSSAGSADSSGKSTSGKSTSGRSTSGRSTSGRSSSDRSTADRSTSAGMGSSSTGSPSISASGNSTSLPGISEPGSTGNTSNDNAGASTGASTSSSMPSKPSMPSTSSSSSSSSSDHTSGSDHSSTADHTSGSDHTSGTDHTPGADHTAGGGHTPGADHTSGTDHTSSADHTSGVAHGPASTSSSSAKHVAQTATFPNGRFQLRQAGGDCLVKGAGSAAVPGPCDAAAAWTYQSSSGELHPAMDSGACLLAATKELEMVSVSSCTAARSWTSHWYLSGTRRLFVRDTDEHDSWRFLGAPGALVVGGVDQRNIPAVPVWSFPAA